MDMRTVFLQPIDFKVVKITGAQNPGIRAPKTSSNSLLSGNIIPFQPAPGLSEKDTTSSHVWITLAQASKFNAATFAKLCRISTRQLRRYCHDRFGRSTQEWLDEQRMIAAGYLLKQLRCVKTVAIELGFKQRTHFSRQFKQHYGLPPSEFIAVCVNLAVFNQRKTEQTNSAELCFLAEGLSNQPKNTPH